MLEDDGKRDEGAAERNDKNPFQPVFIIIQNKSFMSNLLTRLFL